MTIKEFVEEARKIHGDKYDYKSVNFIKKTDKEIGRASCRERV